MITVTNDAPILMEQLIFLSIHVRFNGKICNNNNKKKDIPKPILGSQLMFLAVMLFYYRQLSAK